MAPNNYYMVSVDIWIENDRDTMPAEFERDLQSYFEMMLARRCSLQVNSIR